MSDQDRIRLAEAMNIPKRRHYGVYHENINQEFNPFTDANDDYAVLEWAEQNFTEEQWTHFIALTIKPQYQYRKGNYARVALKVLDKLREVGDE